MVYRYVASFLLTSAFLLYNPQLFMNENDVGNVESYSPETYELFVRNAYADFYADKRLHNSVNNIKLELEKSQQILNQMVTPSPNKGGGGWDPPGDDWQAEIDKMKKVIQDLQKQVDDLKSSPSQDVGKLKEQMAKINDQIQSLTTEMDNMIRGTTEQFKQQVEQLSQSIQTITLNVNDLANKVAELENKVENNFLSNIVSQILRSPDRPTVNLFRTTQYKAGSPTKVLSSIINIAYKCPTSGIPCFKQLLNFLSILVDDPVQYMEGMESLYDVIVHSSDLYDKSRVFVLTYYLFAKWNDVLATGNAPGIDRMKTLMSKMPTTVQGLVTTRNEDGSKDISICSTQLNEKLNMKVPCCWNDGFSQVTTCQFAPLGTKHFSSEVFDFQGDDFETVRVVIYNRRKHITPNLAYAQLYDTGSLAFKTPLSSSTDRMAKCEVILKRGNTVNFKCNVGATGEMRYLSVNKETVIFTKIDYLAVEGNPTGIADFYIN